MTADHVAALAEVLDQSVHAPMTEHDPRTGDDREQP